MNNIVRGCWSQAEGVISVASNWQGVIEGGGEEGKKVRVICCSREG